MANKTWKQLYDEQNSGAEQSQMTQTTDVGSMQNVDVKALSQPSSVQNINPAGITQSFYTTPTTSENYESGRPVYEQSQALKDAAEALAAQQNAKPGEYQSQWGDKIQEMINSVLDRPAFSYDWAEDPMYQYYAQEYQRGGEMAMENAMAQSAQLTGGYGNSYAQQAGQQTYQRYMEELYDMLPQLRDAAYQMYQDEGNTLRANLSMLQGQEETEYGRYRDTVNDWRTDLDMIYQMYSDMSTEEYNRYVNDQAAWENDRDYWYQKAYNEQQQANWLEEFLYQKEYDAQQQANWEKQFNAQYGGSGSSGGSSGKRSSSGSSNNQNVKTQTITEMINNGAKVLSDDYLNEVAETLSQAPEFDAASQFSIYDTQNKLFNTDKKLKK